MFYPKRLQPQYQKSLQWNWCCNFHWRRAELFYFVNIMDDDGLVESEIRVLFRYQDLLSGFRDSHYKDKAVIRPSYFYYASFILVTLHLYIEMANRKLLGIIWNKSVPVHVNSIQKGWIMDIFISHSTGLLILCNVKLWARLSVEHWQMTFNSAPLIRKRNAMLMKNILNDVIWSTKVIQTHWWTEKLGRRHI